MELRNAFTENGLSTPSESDGVLVEPFRLFGLTSDRKRRNFNRKLGRFTIDLMGPRSRGVISIAFGRISRV